MRSSPRLTASSDQAATGEFGVIPATGKLGLALAWLDAERPNLIAAITDPLSTTRSVTPQPPGRTPHRSALRLPCGETLPVPGASPRTPVPPETSALLARAPPAR